MGPEPDPQEQVARLTRRQPRRRPAWAARMRWPSTHAARDVDLDQRPSPSDSRRLPPRAASSSVRSSTASWSPPRIEKPSRSPSAPAVLPPPAEEALEEVAEVAAAELDAHVLECRCQYSNPLAEPGGAGDVLAGPPVRAEPVVALALLGVAQDLVGLRDLLEAILGARLLVDVRVVAGARGGGTPGGSRPALASRGTPSAS